MRNSTFSSRTLPAPIARRQLLPDNRQLATDNLVHYRRSLISHRHDDVRDKARRIVEHRDRFHTPIDAGRQQIPAPFVGVEAQNIGLAIYFESQLLFLLPCNESCQLPAASFQLKPNSFNQEVPPQVHPAFEPPPNAKGRIARPLRFSWQLVAGSWELLYFFSSTSTYSASITPSSFFGSGSAPPAAGSPPGAAPPAGGVCALYMASASLCEAAWSFSRAEFIGAASVPSSAFFASASAFSTSLRSWPLILSPCSLSIFSML